MHYTYSSAEIICLFRLVDSSLKEQQSNTTLGVIYTPTLFKCEYLCDVLSCEMA